MERHAFLHFSDNSKPTASPRLAVIVGRRQLEEITSITHKQMTQHAQQNFNNGLEDAATRHGVFPDTRTEFERYREGRDLPAKKTAQSIKAYTPPEKPTIQPYKSPAHAILDLVVALAPPVVGIVAVGGILWVVVAACAAAVGAVTAFVSAYALPIGGGLTALVFLVLAVFGAKVGSGGGSDSGSAAKPGGQNVNININVAGGTVTTNQNKS